MADEGPAPSVNTSTSASEPSQSQPAAEDIVGQYTMIDKKQRATLVSLLKILGLDPKDLNADREDFEAKMGIALGAKLKGFGMFEESINKFIDEFSQGNFLQKLNAVSDLFSAASQLMHANDIKLSTLAYALLSNQNLENVLNHHPNLGKLNENMKIDQNCLAQALEEGDELDNVQDYLKGVEAELEAEMAAEIDKQEMEDELIEEQEKEENEKAVQEAYDDYRDTFDLPEKNDFEGPFDFENVDVARDIKDGNYEGFEPDAEKAVCVQTGESSYSVYSEKGFAEQHKDFGSDGSFHDHRTGVETNLSSVFKIDKEKLNDLADDYIKENSIRPQPPMTGGLGGGGMGGGG